MKESARLNWLGVIALSFVAAGSARSQTVDELVAKNLAAHGGAEKLRAIRSMVVTGTINFGSQSSPITVKAQRPNKIREDFAMGEMGVTRAFDGRHGWQSRRAEGQEQAAPLTGGDEANIQEEAENAIEGPLLDYQEKNSKLEMLGKVTWNGKLAYKLKLTTHLGSSVVQYLDAATFLEVHEEIERSENGKRIVIVQDFSDFRDVGGVKFAFRFVSGPAENPQATTLQVDKMQINVPIAENVFAAPQ